MEMEEERNKFMLNEMMHRPIVKEDVLAFLRTKQKPLPGLLGEIEQMANEKEMPIIPHETVMFLQVLLKSIRPQNILEIGAAIGFSSSLMAQFVGENGHVTTIDRFDVMIERAKANYEKLNLTNKVTLLEGQANEILPTLKGQYDIIFMDCAKSQYINFLPECLGLLKVGGVLIVDDVLQGGTVLLDEKEIPKRTRVIHRRLNEFLETVMNDEKLTSSIIPLGDGLLLAYKDVE